MKKTIWSFFIDHFRLTYIFTVGIVIFGILSIIQIPKESAPEIDFPIVVVTTTLPGATADDIEELITDRLERRLRNVSDVDAIRSQSGQGFSQIVIEFDVNSDSKEKLEDVRIAVDSVIPDLPSDASDPVVQQVSFSDVPIATFSVSGPYSLAELKEYAEEIQKRIEGIKDVSRVNVIGAPVEEIEVLVIPERLALYGLSTAQVSSAISQSNIDLPIGSVETAGDVYALRFDGRIQDIQDVQNISIATIGRNPISLGDVADIRTVFVEGDTATRFGSNGSSAQPAVLIDMYKQSGEGNILSMIDTAEATIAGLKGDVLPSDVEVATIHSDAELIRTDLSNLLSSGYQTIAIIIVVLVVFLGWREALLMALQVPLTFFITFIVLVYLGYTINFLTLFSLILALGILVDAGIVMVESMFEKMRKGVDPRQSALNTLSEFQMPLISGMLTTIFVFLPMLLMSGIMGKFIESIPVTVTTVLLASIVVALGFITAFATRFLRVKAGQQERGLKRVKVWIARLYTWYGGALSRLIESRKRSKRLLWTMAILFVVAIALPVVGIVKLEMFPAEDLDTISLNMENPVGTPFAVTNAMAEDIEAVLSEDPRIDDFISRIGSGSSGGSIGSFGASSHRASFTINLVEDRDQTSQEILSELESSLRTLVTAEVSAAQQQDGPSTGAPVQIRLLGDSLEDLESAAITVANALRDIPGTRNVETGIQEANGELVFEMNRSKARAYGVTELQIAQELRNAVSGTEATSIQRDGNDINVIVSTRLGRGIESGGVAVASVSDLNAVTVQTQRGAIPISAFGEIRLAPSRSTISHEDGDRVLIVTAETLPGANTASIVGTIGSQILELGLPESVRVSFGGEAEDIQESFTSLGQAMLIGIFAIFSLLVWQFRSYRQPFFVVMTIPLALIGVFAGLALTGNPISFPGFIGIVALAGIVVNNAIILIDSINSDRRNGMTKEQAIASSAKSRLQPIILTTLTTVSGLAPLALSSPSWAPLAVSIMSGLLFSTVLTLFVIPVLYLLFGEKELES